MYWSTFGRISQPQATALLPPREFGRDALSRLLHFLHVHLIRLQVLLHLLRRHRLSLLVLQPLVDASPHHFRGFHLALRTSQHRQQRTGRLRPFHLLLDRPFELGIEAGNGAGLEGAALHFAAHGENLGIAVAAFPAFCLIGVPVSLCGLIYLAELEYPVLGVRFVLASFDFLQNLCVVLCLIRFSVCVDLVEEATFGTEYPLKHSLEVVPAAWRRWFTRFPPEQTPLLPFVLIKQSTVLRRFHLHRLG